MNPTFIFSTLTQMKQPLNDFHQDSCGTLTPIRSVWPRVCSCQWSRLDFALWQEVVGSNCVILCSLPTYLQANISSPFVGSLFHRDVFQKVSFLLCFECFFFFWFAFTFCMHRLPRAGAPFRPRRWCTIRRALNSVESESQWKYACVMYTAVLFENAAFSDFNRR